MCRSVEIEHAGEQHSNGERARQEPFLNMYTQKSGLFVCVTQVNGRRGLRAIEAATRRGTLTGLQMPEHAQRACDEY